MNKKILAIVIIVATLFALIQFIDKQINTYIGAFKDSQSPNITIYKDRDKFEFSSLKYWVKYKCNFDGGKFYWCGNEYTCQEGACTRECSSPICVH